MPLVKPDLRRSGLLERKKNVYSLLQTHGFTVTSNGAPFGINHASPILLGIKTNAA
jgi:hypothetical protein